MTSVQRAYLKTSEAAVYTGFGESTVRTAAEAGELHGVQRIPGRSAWRFRESDLDRWVAGLPPVASEQSA